MIRLRAWWVLGLVLGVSGCAGANRRPAWQPAPPMIGRTEPAGARAVREPALAEAGPALGELGPETRREPRILSRYFPGLFRRGHQPSSPPEPPLADDSRPQATASAPSAARRGRAATAADGSPAPLLSVAIDIPAPRDEDDDLPDAARERLASLETAHERAPEGPSAPPDAEDTDAVPPPPLVEAARPGGEPGGAGPIATDPDSDPVLAGRPRMRSLPPAPGSPQPADLPAATFPRTYYDAGSPPVATRIAAPEPEGRPRRLRWPRLFLPGRGVEPPAASARGEADDVAQQG